MRKEERIQYAPDIRLLDIECEAPGDWDAGDATHIRVSVPAGYNSHCELLQRGFHFVDRTLDVSINLLRSKQDYSALVRTEPILTGQRRSEVCRIAQQSFPTDRRFHLSVAPNQQLAGIVIARWVDWLDDWYLIEHNGEATGFLALTGDAQQKFVHLAAVLEKFRASGAAMSLYAAAARDCKAGGARFLNGRVSSSNTAVMNLYAFLGGSFSNPMNVYLKEV